MQHTVIKEIKKNCTSYKYNDINVNVYKYDIYITTDDNWQFSRALPISDLSVLIQILEDVEEDFKGENIE